MCLLIAACSGDDTAGDPTGASEPSTSSGSSEDVGDDAMVSESTTDAVDSTGTGTADDAAETTDETSVDDILGDWESVDSFDADRPDHLLVRPDATCTAEFRYLVEGNPWEVRLESTITVADGTFAFAFYCEDPTPECVELEFVSHCELVMEQLTCSAPEWFYRPEIVFERML